MRITLFIMFSIATAFLLCSCFETENKPFCVTYKVVGHSHKSYKVSICYRADTGTVYIDTTAKKWSKEVCLPTGEPASLIAYPIYTSEMRYQDRTNENMFIEESPVVNITISHEKKTITDSSDRITMASLTPNSAHRFYFFTSPP